MKNHRYGISFILGMFAMLTTSTFICGMILIVVLSLYWDGKDQNEQ